MSRILQINSVISEGELTKLDNGIKKWFYSGRVIASRVVRYHHTMVHFCTDREFVQETNNWIENCLRNNFKDFSFDYKTEMGTFFIDELQADGIIKKRSDLVEVFFPK